MSDSQSGTTPNLAANPTQSESAASSTRDPHIPSELRTANESNDQNDDDEEEEEEEDFDAEDMLVKAVKQYTGLTGDAAVNLMSQMMSTMIAARSQDATATTTTAAAAAALDTNNPSAPTAPLPPLPKIRLTSNKFSINWDTIPPALTASLANNEFLPLVCFLTLELRRRNRSKTQYRYKHSTTHVYPVIDVTEYENKGLDLSRVQFLDAHRNLRRTYKAAYKGEVLQDLIAYQECLKVHKCFQDDKSWPAFLLFDNEIRSAWHNGVAPHFRLSDPDNFKYLEDMIQLVRPY